LLVLIQAGHIGDLEISLEDYERRLRNVAEFMHHTLNRAELSLCLFLRKCFRHRMFFNG